MQLKHFNYCFGFNTDHFELRTHINTDTHPHTATALFIREPTHPHTLKIAQQNLEQKYNHCHNLRL